MENEPVISYSIKEIVDRLERKLDSKFDAILSVISGKASAADMARVIETQTHHGDAIGELQHWRESLKERTGWRTEWRRWLTTTILGAALVAVSAFQMLHG
jgi:hypothetical protein